MLSVQTDTQTLTDQKTEDLFFLIFSFEHYMNGFFKKIYFYENFFY